MRLEILPFDNVLPQTASELICLYLGFHNDKRIQRCLAIKQNGKRCSRKGNCPHFCTQHIHKYNLLQKNILVNKCSRWEKSLYSLALILQGPNTVPRKYKEPKRCDRCNLTWNECSKECRCPCFCINCTPGRHWQKYMGFPFYLGTNITAFVDGIGFDSRFVPTRCNNEKTNRPMPSNHPNCEYCIRGRTCHKIDS
jgi:hypothetical protein